MLIAFYASLRVVLCAHALHQIFSFERICTWWEGVTVTNNHLRGSLYLQLELTQKEVIYLHRDSPSSCLWMFGVSVSWSMWTQMRIHKCRMLLWVTIQHLIQHLYYETYCCRRKIVSFTFLTGCPYRQVLTILDATRYLSRPSYR